MSGPGMDVRLDADREWWLVDRETGELFLVTVDRSHRGVRQLAEAGTPASWVELVGHLSLNDVAPRGETVLDAVENAARELEPELAAKMKPYRNEKG
jgi:hypothetical protein